ncbi:MAG TPA: cyclic nucleotide-binding domain-containing protein, partial [Spirochaetota bacterium]|nr:cyclic nucleotide-binding domain-containing protein [Spirochaetota bacterium]
MAESVEQLKSGNVLFVQGEKPSCLYMLQSGSIEILSASDEYDGLDRSIVLSKSKRTGMLSGKTLLSGFAARLTGPYRRSVRAVTDCEVAKYPLPASGIQGFADSDPAQALNILKHLYGNIKTVSGVIARFTKLYQTVCVMTDNMGLLYKEMSETNASERLHHAAEDLHNRYRANRGPVPDRFDARFLITDNGKYLGKEYHLPEAVAGSAATKFDDFILRTLQLDQNVVVSMFKADATMAASMYDGLLESFIDTLERIGTISHYVDKEFAILFGEQDSWASYLMDSGGMTEWERSAKYSPDFLKNFLSLLVKVNGLYEELSGRKLTALFPSIRKIHAHYSSGKTGGESAAAQAPAAVSTGAFSKSIHQIFEFALVQKDFRTRFLKLLNEFKTAKNPMNTEQEGRKLRRQISLLYWDLYKQVYVRSRSESAVPRPAQMMLSFGFLDEGLLEPAQVEELAELSRIREKSRDIPVLMETEFLGMIAEGKVEPSITEMGLTYQGH